MTRTQRAFDDNLKSLTTTKKKITRTKKKEEERITFTKTKDESKFPHGTSFIFRFEDKRKNPQLNLAWFQCLEHIETHIERYKLKKKDYRIIKKV